MGNSSRQEAENQTGGESFSAELVGIIKSSYKFEQAITVIPRKYRLRIYVDGEDKYYRLRELKRGLADVVVKVTFFLLCRGW